MALNIQP